MSAEEVRAMALDGRERGSIKEESEDGQSVIYSLSSLNFIFIFALDDFLMT